MLATLGGLLALLSGSAILLLPLLTPELSRPRDAAWGALVLLLGLDLVTTADRLSGAPMLGVLCAGLLIGRLGTEVARSRWTMLTPEERQQLSSAGRWQRSLDQLVAAASGLLGQARGVMGGLGGALGSAVGGDRRARGGGSGKRWVRPESPAAAADQDGRTTTQAAAETAAETGAESEGEPVIAPESDRQPSPPLREVSDFGAIETLLIEAGSLPPEPSADPRPDQSAELCEPAEEPAPPSGDAAAGGSAHAPDPEPAGGAG